MAKTNKPVITTFPKNYRIRMFSVRKMLSRDLESYRHPIDAAEINQENFQDGTRNEAYLLAEKLFEVEGVQSVSIDVYDVWITIGKAFKWPEVEGKIISQINSYINVQKNLTEL